LARLYRENTFRKLVRDKAENNYLIFPKKEEGDMEIFQNKYDDFNFQWYLEQCAKINAKQPELNLPEQGRKARQMKKSLPDPNYRLDNYQELKEQWKKKNAKK
jgi:hypothetical protein